MRAMNKVALVLTTVMMTVSLAVLQSGCAGSNSSSNENSGGGTTTPPPTPPPPPPPPTGSLQSVNHIIFMAQENRSMDEYFGRLPDYWAANNFSQEQFDALPLGSTNPGCNPLFPPPMPCTIDQNSPQIKVFH